MYQNKLMIHLLFIYIALDVTKAMEVYLCISVDTHTASFLTVQIEFCPGQQIHLGVSFGGIELVTFLKVGRVKVADFFF